ncbi:unnamed protein product [Musa acuminata subsp. burmannicoides]
MNHLVNLSKGADRQLWFASRRSLSYLDGRQTIFPDMEHNLRFHHFPRCSFPSDYGFDPLGPSDSDGTGRLIEPKWLA